MNVKEAARRSDLPAKRLRYYDEIGLVVPTRLANGYRQYAEADVQRLRFLARARSLGFPVDDCRVLLSLYADQDRESGDVKAVVQHQLDAVSRKLRELESMRDVLRRLADECAGDRRPQCPILADFALGSEGGGIDGPLDAPRTEH